jgi:ribosome biogenesis ATPase
MFKATRHLTIPQNYRQLGVPPPRGCVLHGPPGCGKTLLANAVAGTLEIPMITVNGTEMISGKQQQLENTPEDL